MLWNRPGVENFYHSAENGVVAEYYLLPAECRVKIVAGSFRKRDAHLRAKNTTQVLAVGMYSVSPYLLYC